MWGKWESNFLVKWEHKVYVHIKGYDVISSGLIDFFWPMFCDYSQSELLNEVDGGKVVGGVEKGSSGMVIKKHLKKKGSNSISGTV